MKKVLLVTHSLTPDKRIDQEAMSLVAAGYEVYLICRAKKKDKIPEFYKEIFIVHLTTKQMGYIPWTVNKVRMEYKEIIEKVQPDIIHANDLPAANIVRKIIPKGVKFIYDDHEVWELYYKLYVKRTKGLWKKIQRRYLQIISRFLSRKVMKQADLVIFVNEYWVEYYKKRGISHSKLISVENYPLKKDIDFALSGKIVVDDFFKNDPRKKIVTASKFAKLSEGTLRNIDNIAEAAYELEDWVVVNFGVSEEKYEKLGVVSIGFKPRFEFIASCSMCDIILNPLVLDELMHHSSPNRFFEAALIGVRIISSEAETLVEKFDKLLIWANHNTPKEDVKKILMNIEDYPTGKEIQKAAQKFTWENEKKKLIMRYKELSSD